MATEDVKIQVGFDMEHLEGESERMGDKIAKNLEGSVGAGGAGGAEAGAAAGAFDKMVQSLGRIENLMRSMERYLQRQLQTSEKGQSEEDNRAKRAERDEDARRGTPDGQMMDPEGRTSRYGRGGSIYRAASGMLGGYSQFTMGGGTESSMYGGIGTAVGALPHPVAQVAAQFIQLLSGFARSREEWREQRADIYRGGGEGMRKMMLDAVMEGLGPTRRPSTYGMRGRPGGISPSTYGLSHEELGGVIGGYGRQVGRPDEQRVIDMMHLQGIYGLGGEAGGLLGATERAGGAVSGSMSGKIKDITGLANPREADVLGGAIGIAMATNLERGRLGEAFSALTKAAQSIVHTQVNMQDLMLSETVIGRMGPQFRGDTAAHAAAKATIDQWAQGQGGFGGFAAMTAAGYGTVDPTTGKEVTWAEAKMRLAAGFGMGGITKRAMVRSMADRSGARQAWLHFKRTGDKNWWNLVCIRVGQQTGTNAKDVDYILTSEVTGEWERAEKDLGAGKGRALLARTDPHLPDDYVDRQTKFWEKRWHQRRTTDEAARRRAPDAYEAEMGGEAMSEEQASRVEKLSPRERAAEELGGVGKGTMGTHQALAAFRQVYGRGPRTEEEVAVLKEMGDKIDKGELTPANGPRWMTDTMTSRKAATGKPLATTGAMRWRYSKFDTLIRREAQAQGVGEDLVHAIIQAESGYDPDVTAKSGTKQARGLMQLMPKTAKQWGVTDPTDPEQNVRGGTKYLQWLSKRYGGDVDRMLVGYHSGPGPGDKFKGGTPADPKDAVYLQSVKENLRRIREREQKKIPARGGEPTSSLMGEAGEVMAGEESAGRFVNLVVTVFDGRISVTRAAARSSRGGNPGQPIIIPIPVG